MRHNLLFILIVFILSASVAAQGTADYRLHVPTASEYLAALPAIVAQAEAEQKSKWPIQLLAHEEIRSRYDADDFASVPFDVLYDASPYILREIGFDIDPHNEYGWQRLLFDAWLRENQPDLASQSLWEFEGYTLEVTPIDFTGDGVDELSVELQHQAKDQPRFTEYFVLTPNPDVPEGYSRLGDIGMWFSGSCAFQLSCGGRGEVLRIEDINGDGLPDWVISQGSCSYGHCGVWMLAFGYQDGQFTDLFRMERPFVQAVSGGGGVHSSPADGVWNFQNLDDDPALEITQIDSVEDNRGCAFTAVQTFDWDGSGGGLVNAPTFWGSETQYTYAPTAMCALRLAHKTMNDLNFDIAAEHYETMLTSQPPPGLEALWDYARVRLALAYALIGRLDDADVTLGQIEVDAIDDSLVHAMVSAAQTAFSAERNPIALCAALHDTLVGYDSWDGSLLIQYGQDNDYGVPLNYGGGDFSPENTGCRLYHLWDIAVLNLAIQAPLVQQIEAKGWHVRAELELDLNGDGESDHLVWPEAVNFGVLKLSDGGGDYDLSVVRMSPPSEAATITSIRLPDDTPALVQISFDSESGCALEMPPQPGSVAIWRLEDITLTNLFSSSICAPQTLEQLFPAPDKLHLLSTPIGEAQIYQWSPAERAFNLFLPPTDTTYEENLGNPLACEGRGIYDFCGSLNDPAEAITLIDTLLAAPPENTSSEMLHTFRYMRAVALELTERPDEALREYVTIVTEAPDSALGMLAALHLEAVSP